MPTTSYNYELAPGDDTDLDDIPVCCNTDMTSKDTSDNGRTYTCGTCHTTVTLAASGLVLHITD